MIVSSKPLHVTIIHPCVGRRRGSRRYIRTWQMESIPSAVLSALIPPEVEKHFYDDRIEAIDFDEPTDLVAISVETYTAYRAYQIASEYRRRGVPVVMGGFHATLCPDEVAMYADSVVLGEAETLFAGGNRRLSVRDAAKVLSQYVSTKLDGDARSFHLSRQEVPSDSFGGIRAGLSLPM